MNNKKGMSGIVMTIIMIALVLVAVGIVWVVIQNILTQSAEDIEIQNKCRQVQMIVTNGDCTGTSCTATISRKAGGSAIDGYSLIYLNADESTSYDADYGNNIGPLATVTPAAENIGFSPSKVSVAAYFNNAEGNPVYCEPSPQYSF